MEYVPATVRAVMARGGAPATIQVGDRIYELTPEEMPGEVEWRLALLKWLGRKAFFYLISLPLEDHVHKLVRVERDLVRRTWLHTVEARAVVQGALLSVTNLTEKEHAALANGKVFFDELTKSEGERLMKRFERMVVRHCRLLEDTSPSGASERGLRGEV
ncbi:hypothetical protein HDG40_006459 [Paraburkholderia sp. JPY158]|uniref:Uncharacterized protein n=1 Tax=Paraburkholderia atlantica TaxID=2654982 RepID=A0A7W8QD72_PARAM|nr:hypothetical protein [Paraburkholderia atlantica]MBB5428272.1 hypothetical protein [Paraburkholderia atlantica]